MSNKTDLEKTNPEKNVSKNTSETDQKPFVDKVKDLYSQKKGLFISSAVLATLSLFFIAFVSFSTISNPGDSSQGVVKGVYSSVRNTLIPTSPEKGMENFYEAVKTKDFDQAKQYMDIDSIAKSLVKQFEEFSMQNGTNIKLDDDGMQNFRNGLENDFRSSVEEGNFIVRKPKIKEVNNNTLTAEMVLTDGQSEDVVTAIFKREGGKWIWVDFNLDDAVNL